MSDLRGVKDSSSNHSGQWTFYWLTTIVKEKWRTEFEISYHNTAIGLSQNRKISQIYICLLDVT